MRISEGVVCVIHQMVSRYTDCVVSYPVGISLRKQLRNHIDAHASLLHDLLLYRECSSIRLRRYIFQVPALLEGEQLPVRVERSRRRRVACFDVLAAIRIRYHRPRITGIHRDCGLQCSDCYEVANRITCCQMISNNFIQCCKL